MCGKESSEMVVSRFGGVRKWIREAVKCFNYKLVLGSRPFSIWLKVWGSEVLLKQG